MHPATILPLLLALTSASHLSAHQHLHARQASSTSLEEKVRSICEPTNSVWESRDDAALKAANLDQIGWEGLILLLSQSPYPCERVMWYLNTYTDFYISRDSGTGLPVDPSEAKDATLHIQYERSTLCSPTSAAKGKGDFFNLINACTTCQSLHGYGEDSDYIKEQRKFGQWIEMRFCNETVPEGNYYEVVMKNNGPGTEWREEGDRGRYRANPPSEGTDVLGGKTEVGLYYTAPTTSSMVVGSDAAAETTNAEMAGTMSAGSGKTVEITSTGVVAAASTSIPAIGGAEEVKAPGGMVMAIFGAMMLL